MEVQDAFIGHVSPSIATAVHHTTFEGLKGLVSCEVLGIVACCEYLSGAFSIPAARILNLFYRKEEAGQRLDMGKCFTSEVS